MTGPCTIEAMERRLLASASALANVNISKLSGNQPETAIAVDPGNPARLFAVSNIDTTGDGLFTAISNDSGATWASKTIADDHDTLPPACCDPSAAFDTHGNLFLAYLDTTDKSVVVARSTDGGQTFSILRQFSGDVDQPTIVTGPSSVWVTFARGNNIVAAGASDGGGTVGAFALENIPGSGGGNFGDVTVGPSGAVMVTWQGTGSRHNSGIYVSVDADGLGKAGFARKPTLVTRTRVGGFDYIPPQKHRGVDAEAGLAWDRSSGAFAGRVYLVYTDETPASSGNTDIFLRYSDNGGATWSNPARVNDDMGLNAQFFPRIALDQTSGAVAVSWYDARNDFGRRGADDTDAKPNTDVAEYAALVTPAADGVVVSPNVRVSQGASSASAADAASPDPSNAIGLGDYEGLVFDQGIVHPIWADNSNSTGDNPDGAHQTLDVYTAAFDASVFSGTPTQWLGGLAGPGPSATLIAPAGAAAPTVHGGKAFTFQIDYSGNLNPATLGGRNVEVVGPGGYGAAASFVKVKSLHHGAMYVATYQIQPPAGRWNAAANGTYFVDLQAGQVGAADGTFAPGGSIGFFVAR